MTGNKFQYVSKGLFKGVIADIKGYVGTIYDPIDSVLGPKYH